MNQAHLPRRTRKDGGGREDPFGRPSMHAVSVVFQLNRSANPGVSKRRLAPIIDSLRTRHQTNHLHENAGEHSCSLRIADDVKSSKGLYGGQHDRS